VLLGLLAGAVHSAPGGLQTCATIEKTEDSAWPAPDGHVLLFPPAGTGGTPGVRVTRETGAPVGHEVLWAAEGEPVSLLFDCSSGDTTYRVYLGGNPSPNPATWQARGGVRLETRPRVDGNAASWDEAIALWHKADRPQGRSLVDRIHQGINPHGPSCDFLARYCGFLDIGQPGRYEFATVSDDASFLLIDGKVVASWPGRHDNRGGRRAQHSGRVRLDRGRHRIDYYNVQYGHGFSVSAAWLRPGRKHFETIPAAAFVPAARFQAQRMVAANGRAAPYFEWHALGSSKAGDLALVSVRFEARQCAGRTCRWIFDDGSEADGRRATHIFCRTALRTVTLVTSADAEPAVKLSRRVRVHPRWDQRREWPDRLFARQKNVILSRDLSEAPVADLRALFELARRVEDRPLMTKACDAGLPRVADFGREDAELFLRMGLHYQHYGVRRYEAVIPAFDAAMSLAPQESTVHARAAVHLAGFRIHTRQNPGEGRRLLDAVDPALLEEKDRRLRQIYLGDAHLTESRTRPARQAYLAAGNTVARDDLHYAVRRRARLEAAKDYLRRGEYDAAARIAREIEWETPLERLQPETGMVMIRVQLGRKEYPFAHSQCLRLLSAGIQGRHEAELRFLLVRVLNDMARVDEAAFAYRELLERHPYEEAAARAKATWGNTLGTKARSSGDRP